LNNLLRDESSQRSSSSSFCLGSFSFDNPAITEAVKIEPSNIAETVDKQIDEVEVPSLPPLEALPALPANLLAPAMDKNSLSTLFGGSLSNSISDSASVASSGTPSHRDWIPTVAKANLSSSCLGNITVPDGQVFAPGSTFVKCWRMVNDGTREWPANTEIAFVGGSSFVNEQSMFIVGGAKPEEVRNVWTGELKAPDAPGHYISYWSLRDEEGNIFGQPIWIDIEVVEPLSRSLEGNLASSSVVVMPDMEEPLIPLDSPKSPATPPSLASEDDDYDALSDTSFVSVDSIGSSSDDEDKVLWTDSRRQAPSTAGTHAMDYVVLYDDNSDEDF